MQSQLRSALGDTINLQKERRVYKSLRSEPLGRRQMVHEAPLPEKAHHQDYKFGISTAVSEPVKNLLYPVDAPHHMEMLTDEDKMREVQERYKRTHQSYGVGEQVKRDYHWQETPVQDPSTFVFGIKMTSNGVVSDCLKPNPTDKQSGFNEEKNIVSMIQQRHNHFAKDPLGRTKPHDLPLENPDDYVFGKRNPADEFDAKACIQGQYSSEEQLPDPDLGKSLRPGFRNQPHDPKHVFGTPTIRSDIPRPKKPSITDAQNYGNEPDAMASIRPSKYSTLGVQDDDFDSLMTFNELKDLCLAANLVSDDEEFSDIFEYAVEKFSQDLDLIRQRDRERRSDKLCTVDLLRKALGEITLAKRGLLE